jgi:hypothetical protein
MNIWGQFNRDGEWHEEQGLRRFWGDQQISRRKLNGLVQGALQRAVHGIDSMHAIHSCAEFFRGRQSHRNLNAANHQDAVFCFNFSSHFRGELAMTCIHLTRFQRASKSAHHSTSG